MLCSPCQRFLSSLASAPSPFGCCFVNHPKQRMVFAFPIIVCSDMVKGTPLACLLSFLESLCSSATLLPNHYLFPECLLSKCFLSALPVISFSCMFYFWVMLPIRVNSAVTPTQIICRSVFSVFFFFLFSYDFIHLEVSCFQFKIHTIRTSREEVTYLNAIQKRKTAKISQNKVWWPKRGTRKAILQLSWMRLVGLEYGCRY